MFLLNIVNVQLILDWKIVEPQEIVDEDDETLKILKNEYGDEVREAVVTALEELNEHNPIERKVCGAGTLEF